MVEKNEDRDAPRPAATGEHPKLDPTPPPDHEDFLEVRALSFRALKKNLEKRRKKW